jgi:hypothetical protein
MPEEERRKITAYGQVQVGDAALVSPGVTVTFSPGKDAGGVVGLKTEDGRTPGFSYFFPFLLNKSFSAKREQQVDQTLRSFPSTFRIDLL